MPPPTSSASTFGQQRVDHRELVGDLRAAEHHGVGPLRGLGELAQHLDLGEHEPARVGREVQRHVVHRRLLAVHHAEPVGDERAVGAGQRRELVGPARRARRRSSTSRAGRTGCSPAATTSPAAMLGHARRRARPGAPGRRAARRAGRRPARASTSGSGPPFGRPRCAVTITCAPSPDSSEIVGTEARMRPSSVIRCRRRAGRSGRSGRSTVRPATPSAIRSSRVCTADLQLRRDQAR